MASTLDILRRLQQANVEFVLVGGMAGVLHGASLVTEDLDVCAPFTSENLGRLIASLDGLRPMLRMQARPIPLSRDPAILTTYRNLYLSTDLGQLDVLSDITGIGAFAEVTRRSTSMTVQGLVCRVIDLAALIDAKRALGRAKDLQVALELEAILKNIRSR